MASYFNLTLDTLAPEGLTLAINDGALYTTSVTVKLTVGLTDEATSGYQMKIWGIDGVAEEAAASWETYAATKSVTLAEGRRPQDRLYQGARRCGQRDGRSERHHHPEHGGAGGHGDRAG